MRQFASNSFDGSIPPNYPEVSDQPKLRRLTIGRSVSKRSRTPERARVYVQHRDGRRDGGGPGHPGLLQEEGRVSRLQRRVLRRGGGLRRWGRRVAWRGVGGRGGWGGAGAVGAAGAVAAGVVAATVASDTWPRAAAAAGARVG